MTLLYITGAPGTGKTTICEALSRKGIEVHDLDSPQFGGPYDIVSNERVVIPPVDERDASWFDRHEWRIDKEAIESLKKNAKSRLVIICGVAESDGEIVNLFDKIIYLAIDNATLMERLRLRTGNDYGKNSFEMEEIISRKDRLDKRYLSSDSYVIDASKQLNCVIRDLLNYIRDKAFLSDALSQA